MTSATSTGRAAEQDGARSDLAIVLVAEVALVAALHLVGRAAYGVPVDGFASWLGSEDPTVVLVSLARMVGLAIGYWLLITTVLYALAHGLGWSAMTRLLRWVTLPVIRRVVQGVTAVSLTGASILGTATVSVAPALAQDDGVVVDSEDDEADQDGGDGNGDGLGVDAAGWPEAGNGNDFWRPADVPGLVGTEDHRAAGFETQQHMVVAGDHLWGIAEAHLRQTVGRDVTEDEICQYWVQVIEVNRGSIMSGDPDMIYPDESVTLPPVFSNEGG